MILDVWLANSSIIGLTKSSPSSWKNSRNPCCQGSFQRIADFSVCSRRKLHRAQPLVQQLVFFFFELRDEGFDLSFQQFFRLTSDDEVIRITDEIDTGFFTSKGLETFSCWVFFSQESFKSVQRTVNERGGDNSTLGSPIRRFVKNVFFHVPEFQPPLENDSVHRDMSQKANRVKSCRNRT
jgi:hypothetical protein